MYVDTTERVRCDHYREIANELRLIVLGMKHTEVAEELRLLAARYERLAQHAEVVPPKEASVPASHRLMYIAKQSSSLLMCRSTPLPRMRPR